MFHIALEGIDGSGKSTQARLLTDRLQATGHSALLALDPGTMPLGHEIRRLILSTSNLCMPAEAFLFLAAKAQLTQEIILPALAAQRIVVSDRYLLSTVVYQGHGGGLPVTALLHAALLATLSHLPHLTLLLDLPVSQAQARLAARPLDRLESRPADYHERLRAGYLVEARYLSSPVHILSADHSLQDIHEEIWQHVSALLEPS
jgi:dTMP kinase